MVVLPVALNSLRDFWNVLTRDMYTDISAYISLTCHNLSVNEILYAMISVCICTSISL